MINNITRSQSILVMIFSFFFVMILVAVFHKDGILTVNGYKEEQEKLRESNETLVRENKQLAQEIHELKTDPFAIEKIAREKLNLVRPGETVYTFRNQRGQ